MTDLKIVESSEKTEKPLDTLLRLASAARLYRSPDGSLHARVKIGDRHETYGLKNASFRRWLISCYFSESGQPPSHWAIQRVIDVLEARAWFDGGTPSVFIRVGNDLGADGSAYYIDLGDPTGRAIWICGEGWDVVDKPDVHFRRPDGLLPLPTPSHDGSINLLRPYVNVTDKDFRLVVAWLTAALRPAGPYPILVLHGEQGTAKTTLARILRLLIDPQDCPLLAAPNSTRDLMATAVNGWLLTYDNLGGISNWLSDSFCRLVSGGGFAARTLFSNDERSVIHAQRPMILNGIDEFVRRGDLIDRCVFLHLPTIPETSRRAEDDYWKAFRADYPRILGGVLDAVAGGLRELPSISLTELPRMADYAKWGEAVGRGLGWAPHTFLSAYSTNRRQATIPTLSDSAVANVLVELGPGLQQPRWRDCSPTELFDRLTDYYQDTTVAWNGHLSPVVARRKLAVANARWPKDTRDFALELRRIAPQLRLHGLSIEFERGHGGRRIVFTCTDIPAGEHKEDVA